MLLKQGKLLIQGGEKVILLRIILEGKGEEFKSKYESKVGVSMCLACI